MKLPGDMARRPGNRICKPFKEPRNRFSAWLAGKPVRQSYFFCRTGLAGYIGWRNRFLGIDSSALQSFTNTDSCLTKTTEHDTNAALAMGCLVAVGKDDPREGFIYNPTTINPKA